VLLAGGANVRFGGRPKGLELLGTMRMADHVLAALDAVCDDVVVGANSDDAAVWFPGRRIVRDRAPGLGALGALESALHVSDDATIVVCAWDMPSVTSEVLDALATLVDNGASCAVPQHDDGRLEPLCAAYASRLAPEVTRMLDAGVRAAHAIFDEHQGVALAVSVLAAPGDGSRTFFNVNTPAQLAQAAHWYASPGEFPDFRPTNARSA
jgi:molybdopterin-guanine dinucleotide biosynthesis protein A